ncbi:hypothetical protein BT69DRAFT_1105728 [Atractiella rhizophila]|nr:hypothetical protein BT69DRAFT_1105728 [Atractiella rhizophila]
MMLLWKAVQRPCFLCKKLMRTFSLQRTTRKLIDLRTWTILSPSSSFTVDPHAVSIVEAQLYYAGLHSKPTLLYRTGKEPWSPPKGPEAQRRLKELCEVFSHPITKVWNRDLAWKVVDIMDTHTVHFTTIDVVRFRKVAVDEVDEGEEDEEDEEENREEDEEEEDEKMIRTKKQDVGRVVIWVGVFPGNTTATAAHNAAQDVLAILSDYEITDIDVEFRESLYTREAGPQLLPPLGDLDPLVDVVSPLTPTLGLYISTKARPEAQGTMALYLTEGGDSNNLLGLSCRHVLISSKEANTNYVYRPSAPAKNVVLLGKQRYLDLHDSIKLRIGRHCISMRRWTKQIEGFLEKEKGVNPAEVRKAADSRCETQVLLDRAEKAVKALRALLERVEADWKTINNRVLGPILRSPAISLGVGEYRFTEDWGVFRIDRVKLGDGFRGNTLDLGTKLTADEFTVKCFPRGDANWEFEYPADRVLPLVGTITDELMVWPDMWDCDGEPCLLVVKNANATGTTLGRANGVFSIVRDYFNDMSINQSSMEWCIINYDSKSEVFSAPGDSGSIIADIRGRIGGMLTGGAGKTTSSDITYATPFWWLLQRIRTNGFPNACLSHHT